MTAMKWPLVWTLMVVTPVHATLGTLEVDKCVVVSISLHNVFQQRCRLYEKW